MLTQQDHPWPIAVFAHNEERGIIACLDSILRASSHPVECYVLANACNDRTEALVNEYTRDHPNVHLVSIRLGDKANAWNVFVHEAAPKGADFYFFIDGDVRASAGAVDMLAVGLLNTPYSNGASALPRSGRNVDTFRSEMIEGRGVAGNLYALRGAFMERIRAQGIRMPIGVIGEDSLIGAMLKWDLQGGVRWDNERVTLVPEAGFEFDPMSYSRPTEWKKYFRRRVRYSIRGFQNRMLGRAIQPQGFTALPSRVDELYRRYGTELRIEWRGVNTFFDWLAKREIQEEMNGGKHES